MNNKFDNSSTNNLTEFLVEFCCLHCQKIVSNYHSQKLIFITTWASSLTSSRTTTLWSGFDGNYLHLLYDLKMPPKEPTTLAGAKFKYFGFSESRPKLLEKLSLDDGMEYFLEWKDQYEASEQIFEILEAHLGFNGKPREFLDPHLLSLLAERLGPDLDDLDHEVLAQELHDIFGEFDEDKEAFNVEDDEDNEDFDEDEDEEVVRITIPIHNRIHIRKAKDRAIKKANAHVADHDLMDWIWNMEEEEEKTLEIQNSLEAKIEEEIDAEVALVGQAQKQAKVVFDYVVNVNIC